VRYRVIGTRESLDFGIERGKLSEVGMALAGKKEEAEVDSIGSAGNEAENRPEVPGTGYLVASVTREVEVVSADILIDGMFPKRRLDGRDATPFGNLGGTS